MSSPLTFGSAGNPFEDDNRSGFDNTPRVEDIDLSGFDLADGKLTVPPGTYICRVERGEVTQTKFGKPAYRLCFKTMEPSEYSGFTLWRWYVLADNAGRNRAKAALAPLGLTTSAALRAPFPPLGKDMYVKALVTLKHDPQRGASNDVHRFELCDPPASATIAPNPFAVALVHPDATNEGRTK